MSDDSPEILLINSLCSGLSESYKEFKEVIDLLQRNVLRGEIEYNDKTRRIMYKPDDIDLSGH